MKSSSYNPILTLIAIVSLLLTSNKIAEAGNSFKEQVQSEVSSGAQATNAYSVEADNFNYETGWYAEALVNKYSTYYKPGEGRNGFIFDNFDTFFSGMNAKMLTPVIELRYVDKKSVLVQFYTNDPTGVRAAVLSTDGKIRLLNPFYTEMLSPSFSCWGTPYSECMKKTYNGEIYYTQTFKSYCGNYLTEIVVTPRPIEYYGSFAEKLKEIGICKTATMYAKIN